MWKNTSLIFILQNSWTFIRVTALSRSLSEEWKEYSKIALSISIIIPGNYTSGTVTVNISKIQSPRFSWQTTGRAGRLNKIHNCVHWNLYWAQFNLIVFFHHPKNVSATCCDWMFLNVSRCWMVWLCNGKWFR